VNGKGEVVIVLN